MTDEEIIKRINSALADEFELEMDELVPEAAFKDDLDLDSLDAVDMVIVLEQEFGIKIKKDEAFKSIRTLGDLHTFILAKKDEAA
ncbi:acyl carrier protein [Desulfovibrio sp. JC010]|uniref:acyl carrier protein n=1 Tax=Desulfovibrio sp. JC010 TaxID=2593641 RepID=UPI0013D6EB08|nr:acyl carrier protein [Desulfovibrio sp. JC010]NDV26726.1 acyl carrier protein [Desulfovibrio sp. JC010]